MGPVLFCGEVDVLLCWWYLEVVLYHCVEMNLGLALKYYHVEVDSAPLNKVPMHDVRRKPGGYVTYCRKETPRLLTCISFFCIHFQNPEPVYVQQGYWVVSMYICIYVSKCTELYLWQVK